jgi:hypothetical protein
MMTDLRSPDAAAAAGISYRQLDWWLTHGAVPHDNPHPGSGGRRTIPAWYIPRLRLMGQMSAAVSIDGNGGFPHTVLRQVFDNYEDGELQLDGFSLRWRVDPDGRR